MKIYNQDVDQIWLIISSGAQNRALLRVSYKFVSSTLPKRKPLQKQNISKYVRTLILNQILEE